MREERRRGDITIKGHVRGYDSRRHELLHFRWWYLAINRQASPNASYIQNRPNDHPILETETRVSCEENLPPAG